MEGHLGWAPGSDFDFYRAAGQSWLETGRFYLPEQLAGPYDFTLNVHVVYPPPRSCCSCPSSGSQRSCGGLSLSE